MQAIINGSILMPDHIEENACLLFEDKIAGLVAPDGIPEGAGIIDAKNNVVIPGLLDMHIHGYLGEDASDGSFEGIRKMAEGLARNGVTGFLPPR